jgi:hypothetical protein
MSNTFKKSLQSLSPLSHLQNLLFSFCVLSCPGDLVDSVDFSSAQNGILRQFFADMEKGKVSFRKVEKSCLHRLGQLSSVGNINKHCR